MTSLQQAYLERTGLVGGSWVRLTGLFVRILVFFYSWCFSEDSCGFRGDLQSRLKFGFAVIFSRACYNKAF